MDSPAAHTSDPLAAHQRRLADVRRQRRRALGLVLLSVPVGLLVPWFFIQLIARALEACLGDLEAGGRFALFDLWLLLALVSAWAFLIGCLAAWKLRMAARVAVGLVAVLLICVAVTRPSVPYDSPTGYGAQAFGECGPGGVPAWWPAILPHQ